MSDLHQNLVTLGNTMASIPLICPLVTATAIFHTQMCSQRATPRLLSHLAGPLALVHCCSCAACAGRCRARAASARARAQVDLEGAGKIGFARFICWRDPPARPPGRSRVRVVVLRVRRASNFLRACRGGQTVHAATAAPGECAAVGSGACGAAAPGYLSSRVLGPRGPEARSPPHLLQESASQGSDLDATLRCSRWFMRRSRMWRSQADPTRRPGSGGDLRRIKQCFWHRWGRGGASRRINPAAEKAPSASSIRRRLVLRSAGVRGP